MEADDVDRRILNGLLEDGRASASELAAVADVDSKTADWHKNVLEMTEVISGYEPCIDYESLGYDLTAVVRINTVAGARQRVIAMLEARPHLHTVYEVAARDDVFAIGKFTDRPTLEQFRDDMRADDGIDTVTVDVATPVSEFEWFTPE
jgi:DNA-binding Lrp family transcriptional regulator